VGAGFDSERGAILGESANPRWAQYPYATSTRRSGMHSVSATTVRRPASLGIAVRSEVALGRAQREEAGVRMAQAALVS
jgi:hypothetical protein